ncbi:superoxide dismutase family protein [Flavobacterium agrisoli]|uniref:Superoxide dismutase [Cu-Zn] n=1 Tax=Flavobacterium agrisoli TaxID=2793066 RepID=A0A934UJY7_9FLAO|nr:superoxide dismutase family protein [Flavobacterium agrisoli]MBK0370034.1 superoxide dismutase family protein [Flavobacterium agrisoli]
MKKILFSLAIIASLVSSCKTNTKSNDSKKLTIALEPKSNSTVTGTATFVEKEGKVTFEAKIAGLKPGVHAIHIHEKSDCSAADGSSAGGHWNPTFQKHGKWGSDSYHKGDIGNFTADKDGKGTVTLTTDEWCIGCGDDKKDILGKGLIVHQEADDYTSQPAGNAGARVACSAIIK